MTTLIAAEILLKHAGLTSAGYVLGSMTWLIVMAKVVGVKSPLGRLRDRGSESSSPDEEVEFAGIPNS